MYEYKVVEIESSGRIRRINNEIPEEDTTLNALASTGWRVTQILRLESDIDYPVLLMEFGG